ncbi:MAG: efflux RND transporter periplasmic adaptor subunit [Myxococcota bacterium]
MSNFNKVLKVGIVPVLILVASGIVAYFIVESRAEPSKKQREAVGVAVQTMVVERKSVRPEVSASGAVVPARQLDVMPQVGGRLTWLYESLDPGTFVEEGQQLFRIDPSDYRLGVDQAQAQLDQAQAQLAIEAGQQEVAREEWEMFKGEIDNPDADPSLALREPQLRSAKVSVDSAQANLESAKLNLRRTSFRAPFNAVITQSNAELQQLVGTQSQIARLVGTDEFWVRVSLPVGMLRYIDIPGLRGGSGDPEAAARVTIRQDVGGHSVERSGEVLRLLSELDPAGRMARVLVSIDDPYGLEQTTEDGLRPYPVLLDAYVDVEIETNRSPELIELPREALREGDEAYVFDPEDNVLDVRKVDIHWRRPDSVLIADGLEEGDQVITSPLANAVDGMLLQRAEDAEEAEPAAAEQAGDEGEEATDE